MKKLLILTLTAVLVLSLAACHKHESATPVSCLNDEVCVECGKIMTEALGHEAGAEATCSAPQTCTRCGEVLTPQLAHTSAGAATCTSPEVCAVCGAQMSPALSHSIGSDGVCSVCGQQVVPAGEKYIPAGKGGYTSDDLSGIVPETVKGEHYHNTLDAYYANAVLVCGDYGIEYFTPDPTGSTAYAATVSKFAAKYPNINTTSLLVPKCAAFESPAGYDDPYEATKSFIQSTYDMMEGVTTADCMGVMTEHDGEYMFYRTDHHWTSLGAYYASVAFCEANGITPYALDSYETTIQTGIIGSLHMYGGRPDALKTNPDYTVAHYPHQGYSMVYYRDGVKYSGEAINGNYGDYALAFMCGDQPLTVITTDLKNGKTLLVFKESYGNAFIPYMIDYFERIVAVDIRETVPSVASLVEEYDVTDALIINNCQGAVSLCSNLESRALS